MEGLGLTPEELKDIVKACAAIRVGTNTPSYIQEFIAERLAATMPALSERVRRFDRRQMGQMFAAIHEAQAWLD